MEEKDKQLLLKDLCARIPYDVVVNDGNEIDTLKAYMLDDLMFIDEAIIKPYLRPLSSMTKEEKRELLKFGAVNYDSNEEVTDVCCIGFDRHADVQDWLLEHNLDFRGLIEKSLAIVAPEDMYKKK